MPSMMSNSSGFFEIAAAAAEQLEHYSRVEPKHDNAVISVVFAASALEAFINERSEWAAQMSATTEQPEIVHAFAEVLADAERARASIQAKFQLASWVLFGKAYDAGSQPYQDFALLVELRNSLVHLKPNATVLKKMEGKGILAETHVFLEYAIGGWVTRMLTVAVAEWAVSAAGTFVADFLGRLPSGEEWPKFIFPASDSEQEQWTNPKTFFKKQKEFMEQGHDINEQ